ncbi:MAG: YihY/virulence factor BrkB family protein [Nocardiopsaceae bacterium]|nr:YihY/virulence factor BrkB family protein [Nocardiopsaceae bacterium]
MQMKQISKAVGAVDRLQKRYPWLAFPVAVWKKFSDDQAGNLAALIAYFAVAAIFPLLLVLGTVLDIVLKGHPDLQHKLIDSALAQYPVIGPQIDGHLGEISGSGLALAFGIVLLVFGARGAAAAMQNAMCEVWDVPRDERPGFVWALVYNVLLTLTVGFGFVLTTFLSSVAGGAGHLLTGFGASAGAILVSFALNVGMFWISFRIASVFKVPWRDLSYGAVIAAVVWQVLQLAGGYIVSHQLQRASSLYGTFGLVLGLMAWTYLQAKVTLYVAEIDAVRVRGLWPRSLTPDGEEQPRVPGQRGDSESVGNADGTKSSGTKVA